MKYAVTGLKLAICLAVLSAAPAFTRTPSDEAISDATAAPVAHVYVQTTKGVDDFTATSTGKLTLVKGSPFATVGQMEGVTSKYLISAGNIDLHVYPIESTGGLGKQVSVINTQDYGGSECGTDPSGVLDLSGRYFYGELFGAVDQNDNPICSAWQTYHLEPNGQLVFLGDMEYSSWYSEGDGNGDVAPSSLSTISSNDKFAYGAMPAPGEGYTVSAFSTFAIAANGLLEVSGSFSESDPADNPNSPNDNGPLQFYPGFQAADPVGNYLVVNMYSADEFGKVCVQRRLA